MILLLKLATSPWFWLVLAMGYGATATKYAVHEHDALISYKSTVEAIGKAQEAENRKIEADNQKRKETADAEHLQAISALNVRIAGLRSANARQFIVPGITAQTGSPDRTCFASSELERAIRSLDQDVQGFVDEGSKAVADLNTAKAWAK